jgi:hypothetical protein
MGALLEITFALLGLAVRAMFVLLCVTMRGVAALFGMLFQVHWRLPRLRFPRVLPRLSIPGPVALGVMVLAGAIWLVVAASVVVGVAVGVIALGLIAAIAAGVTGVRPQAPRIAAAAGARIGTASTAGGRGLIDRAAN